MTKKLRKKKQPVISKTSNAQTPNKGQKTSGHSSIIKNNNKNISGNHKKKLEKKKKRLEKTKFNKSYNKKVFNSFAFPDKPVVDCGIIDKKNYLVVPNVDEERKKNDNYYSKTLFKLNKKGEIKQFFLIQILQDINSHQYTTYNRKGNFPNYGKAWRYDVYSFNDALLDFYETINKYSKEGYEEYALSELVREKPKEIDNKENDNDKMEEEINNDEKKSIKKEIVKKEIIKEEKKVEEKIIEEKKKEKFEISKTNIIKEEPKNIPININIQNNIINNNTIANNVQVIYPKKKLFISYKKESPKKIINKNMPFKMRFNVIKDDSLSNKAAQINKQNELDALKKIFNGEAEKKQESDKIDEELMDYSNQSQEEVFSEEDNNNSKEEEEDNNTEEEDENENNENNEKDISKEKINEEDKNKNESSEIMSENDIQKPIIKLIRLIFDIKEAKKYLSFLGIDIVGLPISKVTNDIYIKALNKLNEIEDIIHQAKSSKFKNKKLFDLSKEYYRIIPHIFHLYHINSFLIDSILKIQKEIDNLELIKSVSNLEIQIKEILSNNNNNNNNNKNTDISISKNKNKEEHNLLFKKELDSLNYNISVMSHSEKDYKDIKDYLNLFSKESKNKNYPKLTLKRIYKLEKKKDTIININSNNQTLLWLGCQIPHFYSLLKNGFYLPPKEAPNSPYIYGKGIMLSTNAFEQAQKCGSRNGTGLLLGCMVDVQNADEVNDVTNFELFLKHKRNSSIIRLSRHYYKDIYEKEKKGDNLITYYNYMVYDLSLINIRYIVKIKLPNFPLNDKY